MRKALLIVVVMTAALLGVSFVYRQWAPADTDEGRVPMADEVLEHVSARASDAFSLRAEALRSAVKARPTDVDAAVALATLELQEGRARGDPRHIGYAQAALAPWWPSADAPDEVLVLRATIKQTMHEFEAALVDLDRLIARDPRNAQAWLTQAVVLAVCGDYARSEQSCLPLGRLVGAFAQTVCLTNARSQHGKACESYRQLETLVAGNPAGLSIEERAWALSTLADAAGRCGETAALEAHLRKALALDPRDHYLIGALTDFLMDQGRPTEALTVLGDERQDDGLLLRRVLAQRALGRGDDDAQELRGRYAASHQRGDVLHQREEARFVLWVEGDAHRALALSVANWGVQKETWDARILLEAALAAKEPSAARPVLDALEQNHTEDPTLLALARRVKALEP